MAKTQSPPTQKWEALLAGLLFLSFFMPWLYSMGAPVAGNQIRDRLASPHHLLSCFSAGSRVSTDYHLSLLLYIIPFGGLLLLVLIFMRRYQSWMGFVTGAITLFIFFFLKGEIESFAFHRLATGSFLTLGSGLGLALTPLYRMVKKEIAIPSLT